LTAQINSKKKHSQYITEVLFRAMQDLPKTVVLIIKSKG